MELKELGHVRITNRVDKFGISKEIRLYTKAQRRFILNTIKEKSNDINVKDILKSFNLQHAVYLHWLKNEKKEKLKESELLKKEMIKIKEQKKEAVKIENQKKETKMEYTILKDSTSSGLIENVKKHISDGWKPIGGHQVVITQTIDKYSGSQHMSTLSTIVYSQTMIKE
jgi:hypothetical protein